MFHKNAGKISGKINEKILEICGTKCYNRYNLNRRKNKGIRVAFDPLVSVSL